MTDMITEQEAAEKWCPFGRIGRIAGNSGVAVNRDSLDRPQTFCIGSRCMAWDAAPPSAHQVILEIGAKRRALEEAIEASRAGLEVSPPPEPDPPKEPRGRCGLVRR